MPMCQWGWNPARVMRQGASMGLRAIPTPSDITLVSQCRKLRASVDVSVCCGRITWQSSHATRKRFKIQNIDTTAYPSGLLVLHDT